MATFQRFHQSNFIHVDKYGAFVTTPRSHFNECSHFQTLQHGPFQSFEEECFFRPFSGQSCSWALALCDRFGDRGFDSRRLPPQTERFPGSKDRIAISKTRLLPPGFLSHPFAHEVSTPTRKTLGPIAAFAGKLSSFDVAA